MTIKMCKTNLHMFMLSFITLIALTQASVGSTELTSGSSIAANYWVPKNPPKAHYKVDCSIDLTKGLLEGTEVIRFKNATSRAIRRLNVKWTSLGSMEITSKDKVVKILAETKEGAESYTVIELPEPIGPNEKTTLQIKYRVLAPDYLKGEEIRVPSFCPQLWWGYSTHNSFEVKIDIPPEHTLATSGVFDTKTGYYRAENVSRFGLFLGKGNKVIKANAEDVLVQVVFKPEAEKCAHLILDTAVDVINFYRQRFGFYPYQSLSIVPGGMDRPAGGYPIATSMVGIHAMEQFDSMPKLHWQWITAHEIGHQYWGEYVMEKDKPGWLWIGMGIYADREYVRAKGLGLDKHRGLMSRYIKGVRAGLDTTINRTPEERAKVKFDFNNVVTHGKGYSVISALDCVLGKNVFDRIYKRCLKEFGGKRLGVHEFRDVCEEESQQDLGWFFDQWVNSNKFLSYEISSKKCEKKEKWYVSKVEVKRIGNLKMPVPVAVYFEDGTSQIKLTNRLRDINNLKFRSRSPLKKVRLDPEEALPFASVIQPAPIRPAEFEIVDVEFEPIHQGKNIVWITVENKSDKEQFFGVGVYSRSVDYGPQGMGWSTNFYKKFGAGETKKLRYVYKIQGPVTKNTYTRLSFYNAKSLQDKDNKDLQHFAKKQYSINDLKVYHSDKEKMPTASQEQFEAVSQAFIEIQQYIHRGDYKQAWDLFTEDYQNIEFRNEFDRFREVMDSESMLSVFLWNRAEFLVLQPESITKKKELFTLTASSQSEFWTIELVSVNDKWKIDWIGGYTPGYVKGYWANWEERLLPAIQKLSTKHFDIYYYKDSSAEKEIEQIAKRKEKGFEEICQFLGQDYDVRICMVFFEDGVTKQIETGHQGVGWAYGNTIVEVYNEQEQLDPYHETTHVLMRPFGSPPALFNEGFAVYVSERLGAHALEDLSGGQSTIYERVRELKSKDKWIPLEELITYTDIGPEWSRPPVAYPEAASFVKFLIDSYGKDKFLWAYKTLKNTNDKIVQQQNIETLEQIYGKSLAELEKEWERAFKQGN